MMTMNFCYRRFKAIFMKECMHIMRDPFTLILSCFLPFIVVLILGNSIEFNLNNIPTVVIDHNMSMESRKLIETFSSSNYFKIYHKNSPSDGFMEIQKENARACIIIPPNFNKNIYTYNPIDVQVLIDGSDNSSVVAILNYLSTISFSAIQKIRGDDTHIVSPIQIKERYMFNPELNSKWFAIPGLSSVIIAIVAILLTSLTICREWEKGSMELLISTPIESTELIIGKISPYAILGSIGFLIVYFCARLIFDVPFVGSHIVLFFGTFLFLINYLGIGLYISITTKIQQVAVQKALIIGLLPTSLLSGFVFPIEYMPDILQYITFIFPARWYVEIARMEFLMGESLRNLAINFWILGLQAIFMIILSIVKFQRRIG